MEVTACCSEKPAAILMAWGMVMLQLKQFFMMVLMLIVAVSFFGD